MVHEFNKVEIKEKLTIGEGQKNIIFENGKISNRSSTLTPGNMPINMLEINSQNILLKPGDNSADLVYIFDNRSGIGVRGYNGKTHLTLYGTEKKENNVRKRYLLLQGDTVCNGRLIVEEIVTANDVLINSSRELKQDISTLTKEEAYSLLENLEPVKFAFKDDISERENIGFIAEDVPDIVSDKDHKSVRYMEIISALTMVVKEQEKRIEELEKSSR